MPALLFELSQKTTLSPLYRMTHPEQAKMYKEILTFDGGLGFASAEEITVKKSDGTVFRAPLSFYESDFLTETYIGTFPNGEQFRFIFASKTNPMASVDPMVSFGSMSTSGWAIHYHVKEPTFDRNKEEYFIFDIEENSIPAFGKILIVKANPLNKNPFPDIDILKNSNRFIYTMNECDETKIFIFSFDENLAQNLVSQAQRSRNNEDFWEPTLNDFTNIELKIEDKLRTCLKHKDLGKYQELPYAISRNTVVTKRSSSTGLEERVKGEKIADSFIYTGRAAMIFDKCIPNGPGIKKKEGQNLKIQGWFEDGKLSSPAIVMYEKYMTVGIVEDLAPNGWTFELCRGSFNFAYYTNEGIIKDVTPLIHGFYNDIRGNVSSKASHNSTLGYFMAFGILAKEDRPFEGFIFTENGDVYVGHGTVSNSYEITGTYLHFLNNGDLEIGYFQNARLIREIEIEQFLTRYSTNCPNVEYIDTKKNLFKQIDSKLYFIASAKQTYDFDVDGVVYIVTAIPIYRIEIEGEQLHMDDKACEIFYFAADDNIEFSISNGAKNNRIWRITPDDYHWMEASIFDDESQKSEKRNVRVHNSLKGLKYDDPDQFTYGQVGSYISYGSFWCESQISENIHEKLSYYGDYDDPDALPF